MQKVKKQLERLISTLNEEIERRNDTYNGRSIDWLLSDRGEEYQDVTDTLQWRLSELEEWMEEL